MLITANRHQPCSESGFLTEGRVGQEISPTATSASFAFAKYIDDYGYVKSGVILKNQYGSGGGSAKIYDTKNKKWLN